MPRPRDDRAAHDFLAGLTARAQGKSQPRARNTQTGFFAADFDGCFPGSGGGGRGGFEGARRDRTVDDWYPGSNGPNRVHQMDGRLLRERARDLVKNNPKARAAVGAYISNVIERGILPKPHFEDADRRKLWLTAWNTWGGLTPICDSQADIAGIDTIYGLQALWLSEVLVAGGCLVHYVELPVTRERRNPLAIELLPEERFAEDRDSYVGRNPKTATIIRGVEVDPATGRPIAYHVRRQDPHDLTAQFEEPLRLPADQCKYGYFRQEVGQYRGVTLLQAVVVWLWRLGYYVDSEMFASQLKSQWAYTVKSDDDELPGLNDAEGHSSVYDSDGNPIDSVQAGMIMHGGEVKAVGPNVPGSDSIPWIRLIEQSIAQGVDLSEVEVTRDYSRVTFSSARSAKNGDKKRYRRVQRFTQDHFCNPTIRRFSACATRAGLDGFPTPSQYVAESDQWLRIESQPPGWESVNPLDDARADDIKLKNRTRTRSDIIAAEGNGGDWEETFEQCDREEQRLEDLGLNQPEAPPANAGGPSGQELDAIAQGQQQGGSS